MADSFAGIEVPEGEPGVLESAGRDFRGMASATSRIAVQLRSAPAELPAADPRHHWSLRLIGALRQSEVEPNDTDGDEVHISWEFSNSKGMFRGDIPGIDLPGSDGPSIDGDCT